MTGALTTMLACTLTYVLTIVKAFVYTIGMAIQITTTWTNDNPDTIWNRLAAKLGRQPTNAEARAEVKRILTDGLADLAEAGKLPHQRRRAA